MIKCSNTKCKNYYHIQYAIQNGLIFNLGFQKDFYGLTLKGSIITTLVFAGIGAITYGTVKLAKFIRKKSKESK